MTWPVAVLSVTSLRADGGVADRLDMPRLAQLGHVGGTGHGLHAVTGEVSQALRSGRGGNAELCTRKLYSLSADGWSDYSSR
jgi:hypothetical protein